MHISHSLRRSVRIIVLVLAVVVLLGGREVQRSMVWLLATTITTFPGNVNEHCSQRSHNKDSVDSEKRNHEWPNVLIV